MIQRTCRFTALSFSSGGHDCGYRCSRPRLTASTSVVVRSNVPRTADPSL
ncbi:hypothetical protein NSERUTF1_6598 [Nocardia seriolae]|nr:hypothetical protein NSERUTF1_6598 [Nocardia seriolae]